MMEAAEIVGRLGWEQMVALQNIKKHSDIEGATLCKMSDCSFGEFYALAEMGLVDAGAERIAPKQMNPTLTVLGSEVLAICEAQGIV